MICAPSRAGTIWGGTIRLLGAGAIGTNMIRHLGRMPHVGKVVIVDKDVYEESNLLSGQAIYPGDVGKRKAQVMARKLRRLNPDLAVEAIHASFQDLPMGFFGGASGDAGSAGGTGRDVIIACLDSMGARIDVNQIAFRMGVPYIDTGVLNSEDDGWFARVDVYVPGGDAPCYECSFDPSAYERVEKVLACGEETPDPTNAPSFLGAMTAALGAAECRKLMEGDTESMIAGRRVLHDLRTHTQRIVTMRRNEGCRFDHRKLDWQAEPSIRPDMSLDEVFQLSAGGGRGEAEGRGVGGSARWIVVEGSRRCSFVRAIQCTSCGARKDTLVLERKLRKKGRVPCTACGEGAMVPIGFVMEPRLNRGSVSPRQSRFSLARLGVRAGDILTAGGEDGRIRHFMVQAA